MLYFNLRKLVLKLTHIGVLHDKFWIVGQVYEQLFVSGLLHFASTPGHNRVLCGRELCYPIQLPPRDPLSYMEINEVIEEDTTTILKMYENKERQHFTSFGGVVHKVHFMGSCKG